MKSFKNCGISNALDGTEDDESTLKRDRRSMMMRMSSRPREKVRVKARVTQKAIKLYCQLKDKNGSFRSHQIYKSSVNNSSNLSLVVLLLGTWLQANFRICDTFPLVLTSGKK